MTARSLHPFPARMSPDIAKEFLYHRPRKKVILDPMAGSGTTLKHALERGMEVVGYDMDPLAVQLSRIWMQKPRASHIENKMKKILSIARSAKAEKVYLDWIDDDEETLSFISFWFAKKQENDLRRLVYAIRKETKLANHTAKGLVFNIALSRLIITKKKGASLAWDVSHSRPHRKKTNNDFEVFAEFEKSVRAILKILNQSDHNGTGKVYHGDARNMKRINDESIDYIVTSPPYLNSIDYLRGHRLSLVWLGHTVEEVRNVRRQAVGAEIVETGSHEEQGMHDEVLHTIRGLKQLPLRKQGMVKKYALDSIALMSEMNRVTRKGGQALLVVGNSRIDGVPISNARIFKEAAIRNGFSVRHTRERKIPSNLRYLPIEAGDSALSNRTKTETIMTLRARW